MGTINFKSVGRTADTISLENPAATTLPIGIITPVRPGKNSEGIFSMTYDLGDQVKDNLRNLIQTNWGERLCLYNFGANLRELTAEFTSGDEFDNEATTRIKAAVTRWMPYVSLISYVSTPILQQNEKTGVISLTITYDVPMLNLKNQALEVTLYVM